MTGRRVWFAGAALIAALGCGSDGGGDAEESGGSGFSVFPPRVFSGADGKNTYRAPLHAQNASSPVTWTISDPEIAEITPSGTNNQDLMITSKKAGTATVTAKHGGAEKSVPLRVYQYTEAQWEAGKRRYTTALDDKNPACEICHAEGKGPNHTPSEVDRDEDGDLIQIITTGVDPEDNPEEPARIADRKEFEAILRGFDHMWQVTEEEKVGLVAYIRSLTPKGRPMLDDD